MEFKFTAFHPDELLLAANFLKALAKLQQDRFKADREAKEAWAENNLNQYPSNLDTVQSGPGTTVFGPNTTRY